MSLEELKTRLRAGRFDLDEVAGLASEALAAIESLQRELEEARRPSAPKMSAGGGPGYLIKDMILAGGGLKGPP